MGTRQTLPRKAQEQARKQADVGNRTRDLLLTMQVLYQLSYVGAASDPSRFGGPT
jgi:hypothetical protein